MLYVIVFIKPIKVVMLC